MFDNLKTAFGGLGGLVGKLRPSPGAFHMTGVGGTVPDQTGGGWDANVQTAFAHPANRLRQGLGAGLMGIGQAFTQRRGNTGAGGMAQYSNILPLLMQMKKLQGGGR